MKNFWATACGSRNIVRPSAAALAALVCSACATLAPPAPDAGMAVPADWVETDPVLVEADITEYWRQLGDPLLTEFVERAIANNLDLAQSAARLEQSRAQLVQARSGLLPQVNGSGGVSRDVGDFASDDLNFSLSADASWEADIFGRVRGGVAASTADLAAAGYSLADLQRLIVGQVALSTVQARAIAVQLAIASDTLGYQDQNLEIAGWRNQAGLVSSLDVEQARTQRAQTAASVPLLRSNLAATANAISTLIGEPPGRVLAQLLEGGDIPDPGALAGFAPPAEVLRRRPDVRQAEANLVAATARVGVARAQLLPQVRLTGNLGTGATDLTDLFDITTGRVAANVSQLIFDAGRTRAQIDSAEASAEGALAAWRQSILGALEDVESAAVDRQTAVERVEIYIEALDAAQNSALLARSQYQAGITDFRNLLSAENSLLSARNSLVSAEADRASSFIRLTQALGGGWSPDAFSLPANDGVEP